VFSVDDFLRSVELDPFSTKGDFSNQVYYAEQRSTIQLADFGGLVVPGNVEQVNRATSPGRGAFGQTHSRPASNPESAKQPRKKRPATSMPAAANVAKDFKSQAELRAGLILTGSNVACGCKNPRTDSNSPRIRAEQNIDHIRTHHQPFRLKIYCPGCPKLLGVDISSEHRKHVESCVPKLSVGGYADVTFARYRGNATYCGERLWMDPMDI
jgi:hypothetical protein